MPPRLAVRDIAFFERQVEFARPFRFGSVVVTASSQAFVLVEVEVEGKGRAVGASSEALGGRWFDKRAHIPAEVTTDELRYALLAARELYLDHSRKGFDTAFGLHAACIAAVVKA